MINFWFYSKEEKEYWCNNHIDKRLGVPHEKVTFNTVRFDPVITHEINILLLPVHSNHYQLFKDCPSNIFHKLGSKTFYWLRAFPEVSVVILDALEVKPITQWFMESIESVLEEYIEKYALKTKFTIINCDSNLYQTKPLDTKLPLTISGGNLYPQYTYPAIYSRENLLDYSNKFLGKVDFKYKAISLNGRHRPTRTLLLSKLIDTFDIEEIIYSFFGLDNSMSIEQELEIYDSIREKAPTFFTEKDIDKVKELLLSAPFSTPPVDISFYPNGNLAQIFLPEEETYSKVFIDIFSETLSGREFDWRQGYDTGLFITEKTCKPILSLTPFIVNSSPHYLKFLKKLGFKTFGKWFDESYDEDMSAEYSMNIILKNACIIKEWDLDKCKEVYEEMLPTLIHNRDILIDLLYSAPNSFINTIYNLDVSKY